MNIPEKWQFILADAESKEMLQQWLKREYNTEGYTPQSHNDRFDFPNRHNKKGFERGFHYNSCKETGYTEISKEQFKQYLLKQEDNTYSIF